MAGVELPEHRQDPLVRRHHLPGRLQPPGVGPRQHGCEGLPGHPLPRIELEAGAHLRAVPVDEGPLPLVPADGPHLHEGGPQAPLGGRVLEVGGGEDVLRDRQAREVERPHRKPGRELLPARHQPLVERVPLVGGGVHVLQPVPLHHRRLDQAGRGVGVELEEARGPHAVPGQVHPAVDGGVAVAVHALPGAGHQRRHLPRDGEPLPEAAGLDDVPDRGQHHLVELGGGPLEQVHVTRSERPEGRLVPVRALGGVDGEPHLLHPALPVLARLPLAAFHRGARFPPPRTFPRGRRRSHRSLPGSPRWRRRRLRRLRGGRSRARSSPCRRTCRRESR